MRRGVRVGTLLEHLILCYLLLLGVGGVDVVFCDVDVAGLEVASGDGDLLGRVRKAPADERCRYVEAILTGLSFKVNARERVPGLPVFGVGEESDRLVDEAAVIVERRRDSRDWLLRVLQGEGVQAARQTARAGLIHGLDDQGHIR
jgi:hypothetical protein